MKTATTPAEVREAVREAARRGERVGLVPTMGSLHQGHLSLVRRARQECGFTVASVFVNPAQFGPGEDLEDYPRNLEGDRDLLEREGLSLLFAPRDEALYSAGHSTWVQVEKISEGLCGAHRPIHFRGVATVVAKLFGITSPNAAYFGQKDWQQAMVIQRMTRDLEMGVDIVICPTVREPDGLALSSRNAYLTPAEREVAPALFAALSSAGKEARAGTFRRPQEVTGRVREKLAATPFEIEYVELRHARSLEPPTGLRGELILAAAAQLGKTRLIDNVLIDINNQE